MEDACDSHVNLLDSEMGVTRDWRKALKSPPAYRIINRTIRGQTQFTALIALIGLCILVLLYVYPKKGISNSVIIKSTNSNYNYTYPLTMPIKKSGTITFRIGVIADLDTNSKSDTEKNMWFSYFQKGYLSYNSKLETVSVMWDRTGPVKLFSSYSLKGRGMELSELVVFDGRLLTFDDRTGLVFELVSDHVVPWVLLMDGNGRTTKGFKSEWATVKDEILYVGSMGKEWTTTNGQFENNNPQYIKTVTTDGLVKHINWIKQYEQIREVLGIKWPGYMIHESGVWSDIHQRWYFLPRRCSKEQYNESMDEHRGCSVLISVKPDFTDIRAVKIPNDKYTRGFSSFKFIPTSNDQVIVALRTEELEGKTSTYITSFTVDGVVLMEDVLISNTKFEGFEFI